MHTSLWQTISLLPLLVTAAPTIEKRGEIPNCNDLEKTYNWPTDNAPWRQSKANDVHFCSTRWDQGVTITKIEAWKGHDGFKSCLGRGPITNLKVTYSNGETAEIGAGNKDCTAGTASLKADEYVTAIEAWPSTTDPTAQGKTHIKTEKQDAWLKDDYTPNQGAPWTQDVGGGILVALNGYVVNGDVVQINFHFLSGKKVLSRVRGKTYYDQGTLDRADVQIASSLAGEDCNPTDKNSTITAAASAGVFQTTTTTHLTSQSFGTETEIKGEFGVPLIGKVEVKETFKFTHETQDSSAVSKQNQFISSWTKVYPEDPQSITTCYMTTGKSELSNVPFTSHVTLVLDDHSQINITERGTLDGTMFSSSFTSSCNSRPIDRNSAADKLACHL